MICFFFWLNGNIFFSSAQTNRIMNNSATNNNDWNKTCAHDTTWFQQTGLHHQSAHTKNTSNWAAEWWSKDQISMIWDPITKSYIYHNKNTRLTFDDPDQALFEEELPVIEVDDEPIDSRLHKYPNITALYNPSTDHYWYHNSFTRTTHFTLNQALFITQHQNHAWLTTQPTTYTPAPTPTPTKHNIFDWTSLTPILSHHQEEGEYEGEEEDDDEDEDVEHRAERMASEAENILLEGLSGPYDKHQEQQNPYTTNSWCGTHIHFPDYDLQQHPELDPVLDHQYYGREAQKRDWANLDYQDFLNGEF